MIEQDYSRPWQEVWPEHATKTGQMKRTLPQEVSTMIYIYRAKSKHGAVEARRVETLLLNTFTNKPVICKEFDGYTELRILTVDDVTNIRNYLQELMDESI